MMPVNFDLNNTKN
ncbi:Protein CBG26303 [Caenorhabditis briggsae]|uniref:Protein CBG26303 n=1 Tax=Caenorhabditis briggsae TaxID=6238 RepID=B6IG76_CAEBR|nr:Protein CBG26303 [Caenorhabditis briggsae]CAR98906.1 Protein CBG26303 [Caenorhabditis briggsae]